MSQEPIEIIVQQLSTGWYHVRGGGPCEWSQPPQWPCDEATIREHAFPEASEGFIREAARRAALIFADGLESGDVSRWD